MGGNRRCVSLPLGAGQRGRGEHTRESHGETSCVEDTVQRAARGRMPLLTPVGCLTLLGTPRTLPGGDGPLAWSIPLSGRWCALNGR